MRHIMLDLETLGTKPGCVVLSIGAVSFDPYDKGMSSTYYTTIDFKNQPHLVIEPATLAWWMQQSEEARKEAFSGAVGLRQVVEEFHHWYRSMGAEFIWANDPQFDCAVWEVAAQGNVPWTFRAPRSCRTIYDLAGVWPDRTKGVHHNALNDAVQQAKAVCEAYAKLGVKHGPEDFANAG